ncbi:GNAT family N-acetyltransferase [Sphingomonas sp. ASV193]|uniref:GNAT family N-acetyltransferase n=1 Tax=Sphingomonas sp. ASV193 TaxID=3144405 RepID=UPI0032E883B9
MDDAIDALLTRHSRPGLRLARFDDDLAPHFDRINRRWIEEMHVIEPVDEDQLGQPRATIVEPGGEIFFAIDDKLGPVGTCGLLRIGPGDYELIKMGVDPVAQGLGVGETLLKAGIEAAKALGATRLFLLTSTKSAAAIRLYERNGFVHDEALKDELGGEYSRCNVAMLHRG